MKREEKKLRNSRRNPGFAIYYYYSDRRRRNRKPNLRTRIEFLFRFLISFGKRHINASHSVPFAFAVSPFVIIESEVSLDSNRAPNQLQKEEDGFD